MALKQYHDHRWRCPYCDFPNKLKDSVEHNTISCVLCLNKRFDDNVIEVNLIYSINPLIDFMWPKSDVYHYITGNQIYRLSQHTNWSPKNTIEYLYSRLSKRHNLGFWKQRRRWQQKKYMDILYKYLVLPNEIIPIISDYLLTNHI